MMCRRAVDRDGFRGAARPAGRRPRVGRPQPDGDRPGPLADVQGRLADGHAGNAAARSEVAAIKVAAMEVAHNVVNRAVQTFGAAGVSDDTVLARLFSITRALQIADGPTEVHLRTIASSSWRATSRCRTARRERRSQHPPQGQGRHGDRSDPRARVRHRDGLAEAGATVVVSSRKLESCVAARPGDHRGDWRGGARSRRCTSGSGTHRARGGPGLRAPRHASTSWSTTPASHRWRRVCSEVSEALLDKTSRSTSRARSG